MWSDVAEATGKEVEAWQKIHQSTNLEKAAETETIASSIPLLYISYDGTGVPMVPWKQRAERGKQPDGSGQNQRGQVRMYIYSDHYR